MSYTLHRGDALTVLKTLPDESIHAVITDPPYNSGGRTSAQRTGRTARAKYVTAGSARDLADFPGENRDQRSYRAWLTELLTEAYRAAVEHTVVHGLLRLAPGTDHLRRSADGGLDLVRHDPVDQARQQAPQGRLQAGQRVHHLGRQGQPRP